MKTFVVAGYFNSKFGDDSRRYEEATISRNRVVLDLDGARKMVAGAAYIAMISNDISRVKTWQDLSFSTYFDPKKSWTFFLESLLLKPIGLRRLRDVIIPAKNGLGIFLSVLHELTY